MTSTNIHPRRRLRSDAQSSICGSPSRELSSHGFSLVEVLLAATILLIVTLGILPMFTHAIGNNVQGQQSTEGVNEARSELERLMQLDFNNAELTVPPGDTVLERVEYWNQTDHEWQDSGTYTPGEKELVRTVEVRQYSRDALADNLIEESEALNGSASSADVHFKEIAIQVELPSHLNSPGKRVTLRVFRGT